MRGYLRRLLCSQLNKGPEKPPAWLAICFTYDQRRKMQPIVYRGEPPPQPIVPGGAVGRPAETALVLLRPSGRGR
jgi:hypothetical protein